ncbi:hypothetical protein SD208_16815 [Ochrobactrum sp. BD67]
MKLIADWRRVLKHAWSVRLILFAGILSGLEVALPSIADAYLIPTGAFAALSVLVTMTAFAMRQMRDLPLVMAADNPQDWAADSTYCRVYTGHIHHESAIEEGRVLVTSMRSPVAKDTYHFLQQVQIWTQRILGHLRCVRAHGIIR